MKHIAVSKKNWDKIGIVRREYSVCTYNDAITLILYALEGYNSKYGPIDIDSITPSETIHSNPKNINSEVLE